MEISEDRRMNRWGKYDRCLFAGPKYNRRSFLRSSGSLVAAAIVAPQVHRAASGDSAARKDVQPAKQPEAAKIERLNVAAIGTGGRGSTIAHQAARLANMVACCDVDGKRAEAFASRYGSHCRVYSDYRHVLDRKDVHAITIGTPDHWHAKIAIEAMRAGKDVYCEKPLTLTIDEGKQICRTVEQTHRVFQVGTQLRSEFGTFFLQAAALARSGRLGQHLKATASVGVSKRGGPFATAKPPATLDWDFWLGQAPRVDYCPERTHFDFRWWLEYSGGQVTDWGVHYVDIAMWALGLENTGPIEIVGRGDFPKVRNGFNVATTFDCTMHFANGSTIVLDSKKNNLLIEGEKGAISVNHRQIAGKPLEGMSKKDKQWLAEQVVKLYRGKQPGTHMGDFFDCIKSRALPISDVFTHHRAVSACHLCNLAMRLRRALRWDPAKQDFPGDAEASSMLSRAQRQPYSIQG